MVETRRVGIEGRTSGRAAPELGCKELESGPPPPAGTGLSPAGIGAIATCRHVVPRDRRGPRTSVRRGSRGAGTGFGCYHPPVIDVERTNSYVRVGGPSAARARGEAGDHYGVRRRRRRYRLA